MSQSLGFSNQTIQVFAYEGFNYVISNPDPLSTLNTVSNSAGLNPTSLYFTKNGNDSYTFQVSDLGNKLASGTQETFTLTNTAPRSATYTVNVNRGRFLDSSGTSLFGRSFTFFKNEPITRIRIIAPSFTLKPPISFPTLPPGIRFVEVVSNEYDISGIPTVTVPNSNYQLIGVESGGSKVVTTHINMAISNERVQLSLDGTPVISNMIDGVAIEPRTLTAILPQGASVLRYTFPTFPNGIVATDSSGNIRTSPFFPTDASYTMVISGTPTLAAAEEFKAAGATSTGLVYTIQASRISPLPLIENTQTLDFAFGETVLFNDFTIPDLYVGVPITPVNIRAETYFSTSNLAPPIASIVSPDLGFGLDLSFNVITSLAQLTGTPTVAGSSPTTFRATNSNGIARDIVKPINVFNDSVTFSSPTDLSYAFILSRPVNQEKPGFYPSNIRFVATATSGRDVILSADALVGTGLSLDSNGFIVGIPTQITPPTALDVVATVSGSPATATKTVSFEIVDDAFTFTDIPSSNFDFIENVPITPFSVSVTTLSGRNVVGFSQTGFPSGLSINPAGVFSGTIATNDPSGGDLTVIATTGFASGSNVYAYTIQPDAVLILSPVSSLFMSPSQPIGPVQIQGVAFSGRTVSNYQFVDLPETYGLTIGSTSGLLNGTLGSGIPPDPLLPVLSNFQIQADAGDSTASLDVTFQTINPYVKRSFVALQSVDTLGEVSNVVSIYVSDNYSNWFQLSNFGESIIPITDFHVKYTGPDTNEINYLQYPGQPSIQRYTVGPGFTEIGNGSDMPAFTTDGSGTWWAVANAFIDAIDETADEPFPQFYGNIAKSVDNGVTWTDLSDIPGYSEDQDAIVYSPRLPVIGGVGIHPYREFGVSLRYKDDVLLLGGTNRVIGDSDADQAINASALMRSTDQGVTWTSPTLFAEVAGFNLDVSGMWLAYGSELYRTDFEGPNVPGQSNVQGYGLPPVSNAVTIKYSTNQGVVWSNATGSSTFITYDITHGDGMWLATGVTSSYDRDVRFSSNGTTWQSVDLSTNPLFPSADTNPQPPTGLGPVMFNGTSWNMFVVRPLDVSNSQSAIRTELYRHDTVSTLASNWTAIDLSGSFPDVAFLDNVYGTSDRIFVGYTPDNLIKQSGDPIPFLTFTTGATGPTITSPTQLSYLLYQYIPITPIQLEAYGTGIVYFFVEADALPPGLTFNPRTNRLSGTPAQIGTTSITIYAKDDAGTTVFTLSFTVIIPRIIRKQEGAGAYTSLLRQYTEVLGAQGARDNRALPNQERALGEFMSPEGPEVVTQSNDCCRT